MNRIIQPLSFYTANNNTLKFKGNKELQILDGNVSERFFLEIYEQDDFLTEKRMFKSRNALTNATRKLLEKYPDHFQLY